MAAKKENLKLKKEELKAKYGDEIVMVVPEALVKPVLTNVYTPSEHAFLAETIDGYPVKRPLVVGINRNLQEMLRYDAELDPSFKQIIPYVILRHSGKVFCTHRLGGSGEARLVGGYSIGTGGHITSGETIYSGMRRELLEEVALEAENTLGYVVKGFILDSSTAVNSVHLGVVIDMVVNDADISCVEKEKLSGEWISMEELKNLYDEGKLESWSTIAYENLFSRR